MAAEKRLRKCSTSWEAYRYLKDRVHDAWLPDVTRQQVRQIIKKDTGTVAPTARVRLGVANMKIYLVAMVTTAGKGWGV